MRIDEKAYNAMPAHLQALFTIEPNPARDEVLAAFPQAPGQLADASTNAEARKTQNAYGAMRRGRGDEPSADSDNEGSVGFKMKPGARRLDSGSAARFFKECNEWQDQDRPQSLVSTAGQVLSLQNLLDATARSVAATWPSLAGIVSSDSKELSTSVTPSESRRIVAACIAAMTDLGSGCLRESLHERRTPCGSLASVAAAINPTGTTTITASLSKSGGSAASATLTITPSSLDRGEAGFRFRYCAKASKRDRDEGLDAMPTVTADPYGQHRGRRMEGNDARFDGKPPAQGKNNHPTVKPTDLMRYLCRLVTPKGGVVLDPFMGSGSTGKAAVLDGFRFIGIEREAEYVEIARARIAAAQSAKASEPPAQHGLFP